MPLSMPRFPSAAAAHLQEFGSRWSSSSQKRWSSLALRPSLLHVSAIALLVFFSFFLNHAESAATPGVCVSHDQPNPLAEQFPNNATGVLNATLAIIPIPLEMARRLIPPQYGILERAYRALLPNFPEGMYPVMLQAAHDHDVQFRAYGITIDDFSRVGFEFPFLDLAGDGYSSFRWAPAQLISATNDVALEGSRDYGTIVSAAEYEPPCDAYRQLANGATYFKGSSLTSPDFVELEMTRLPPHPTLNPYPLELFKNITNQPTFANATTCDNMIRLFNTTMSVGEYAPVPVRGRVRALAFPFEGTAEKEWTGVYGVQVATPFIENNYLDCNSMRGYSGTGGPGDSYIPGLKPANEDV
ncbi:hypothetical protein C8A00DRAFT_40404 [Chaetomidium leptoderma]|uniref:Uncharacterized protein n=1 Tax=Chaetomidium leptoderma TaxID=669021 RepID=A0AAN7A046_9PEZI|nr:hypothetical protein C8A00DRAFT_40404 [Chaetomidium leptoderma]